MRANVRSIVALVGLSLVGCGGGGGDGGEPTTVTIVSPGGFDGAVDSTGNVGKGAFPQAGSGSHTVRGYYMFVIDGEVPAGARIEAAALLLDQFGAQASTYASLGDIVCDHIDLDGLPSIDGSVFSGHTLAGSFGLVSGDETPGVKTVDVTSRVQADVDAGRTTSSYRIHFSAEGPLDQGAAFFSDGDGNAPGAEPPRLVVTFR